MMEKIIRIRGKFMDQLHEQFLTALRAALRDEPAHALEELTPPQLERLLALAATHQVLPMIYEAVHSLPSVKANCQNVMAACKFPVFRQVTTQAMKTSEFLSLNRHLHASGIQPLVVKGLICRQLYPKPDLRASSDEDVLIRPEWSDRCHRALLDFGMATTADAGELACAYEIPYVKPGSPLYIELHKHLFPPESGAYGDFNRFFDGIFDRSIEEQINGVPVRTLDHTDHFFYLICHAFKHFLHSGFGIRQVCDIILYANTYGSRIDWEIVLLNCRQIRAERFVAALLVIGEKYLVFDPDTACLSRSWRSIQVDENMMLEDLLLSGVYGNATNSRIHSSTVTLEAVSAQKQGKQAKVNLLSSLFPPAGSIASRFPYLKKAPWLLPVAWVHRIVRYGLETRRSDSSNATEALKIGTQRVELMRQYGIIE